MSPLLNRVLCPMEGCIPFTLYLGRMVSRKMPLKRHTGEYSQLWAALPRHEPKTLVHKTTGDWKSTIWKEERGCFARPTVTVMIAVMTVDLHASVLSYLSLFPEKRYLFALVWVETGKLFMRGLKEIPHFSVVVLISFLYTGINTDGRRSYIQLLISKIPKGFWNKKD